jgi:hypothetical protein
MPNDEIDLSKIFPSENTRPIWEISVSGRGVPGICTLGVVADRIEQAIEYVRNKAPTITIERAMRVGWATAVIDKIQR